MSKIDLDTGKIYHENKWFSVNDLKKLITEKIQKKDMKFATYAAVLEELSKTLENAHSIDIRLVLLKDDYERLIAIGGKDDKTRIRNAVMTYIDNNVGMEDYVGQAKTVETELLSDNHDLTHSETPEESRETSIQCIKCKSQIKIDEEEHAEDVKCPTCSSFSQTDLNNENGRRYKDHFLG